jgi:hypothetical protein
MLIIRRIKNIKKAWIKMKGFQDEGFNLQSYHPKNPNSDNCKI